MTTGYLEHLLQGHRKWKVQGLLGLKCCQKNVFSLSFSVEIESSISIKGREFQSRGKRLKYSLLWILFLGLEWRSLKNVADRVYSSCVKSDEFVDVEGEIVCFYALNKKIGCP